MTTGRTPECPRARLAALIWSAPLPASTRNCTWGKAAPHPSAPAKNCCGGKAITIAAVSVLP